MNKVRYSSIGMLGVMVLMLSGCLRLEVATPDKPITINMNVKIEHEIQIKVDRQVEELLKDNADLFGEVLTKPQTTN
ncbi:YnbE family lipoprotein [Moellerella wisconsensis]|uniref:YnbE family lipoprotein n=3 Tax=Moellerella wisconsensis TaxID=158849 RepID=A0ACD3YBH2_9GAMM|nr:YnbE family lipoprotein [Moellerella wisconsensis]KPD02848.1 putative lipoprotein [Moellerella wisconsensis ATCC 35017]UNH25538.1 YnbE family lipoprotein [Moellerella wisconsensis]UNH32175.1 YnbE family lipoprotein [Moellerella wisconsensis]UNH40325.1 YnbE family lipoprotein [Moellerella wisconsensis]WJW83203.1 YnbE family lipoprotein [Moellerella wisconsensis]